MRKDFDTPNKSRYTMSSCGVQVYYSLGLLCMYRAFDPYIIQNDAFVEVKSFRVE